MHIETKILTSHYYVSNYKELQKSLSGQLLVQTHACNPSYLGGRDQEHCISKPAWADSS
jgi:hypothetical protein